jgi:hypothetical protein
MEQPRVANGATALDHIFQMFSVLFLVMCWQLCFCVCIAALHPLFSSGLR